MTDLSSIRRATRSIVSKHHVLDGMLGDRHSCRGFLPDPVDEETLSTVLSTAQKTASWCNSQPWQVIVVVGEALERLRSMLIGWARRGEGIPDIAFPKGYIGIYKGRRRETAERLYRRVGVASGDRAASARQTSENFRLFGAPALCVITTDRTLSTYGAIDCGAYVANFLLAAESLGLATIAQAAIAEQSALLHDALGIPPDRLVVCGISVGYEDPDHPANQFRTDRAPLKEVVRWIRT
jgi:nitroreductase